VNSTEAIQRMMDATVKAEISADETEDPQARADLWIKIAERWEDVVWRLHDAEERAAKSVATT